MDGSQPIRPAFPKRLRYRNTLRTARTNTWAPWLISLGYGQQKLGEAKNDFQSSRRVSSASKVPKVLKGLRGGKPPDLEYPPRKIYELHLVIRLAPKVMHHHLLGCHTHHRGCGGRHVHWITPWYPSADHIGWAKRTMHKCGTFGMKQILYLTRLSCSTEYWLIGSQSVRFSFLQNG